MSRLKIEPVTMLKGMAFILPVICVNWEGAQKGIGIAWLCWGIGIVVAPPSGEKEGGSGEDDQHF